MRWLDLVLVLILVFLGFLVFNGTWALADFLGGFGVDDFFTTAFLAFLAGLPLAPILILSKKYPGLILIKPGYF
ncbi:MAG: hypothetical protein ACO3O2_05195 [Candidatus Nanopelagicales bacterium]|jgi:hypothetical protein